MNPYKKTSHRKDWSSSRDLIPTLPHSICLQCKCRGTEIFNTAMQLHKRDSTKTQRKLQESQAINQWHSQVWTTVLWIACWQLIGTKRNKFSTNSHCILRYSLLS